jgi:hypothetical protein
MYHGSALDSLARVPAMTTWKQLLDRFWKKGPPASDHNETNAGHANGPSEDTPIARRELSAQEMSWVRDLIAANPAWNNVEVGQLYAIAKCPCGECKSVKLERPPGPQNPSWKNLVHGENSVLRFGFPVGSAYIKAKDHGLVQVMLFTEGGFLDWLDVVSMEFKPMPETIEELSRDVTTDHA